MASEREIVAVGDAMRRRGLAKLMFPIRRWFCMRLQFVAMDVAVRCYLFCLLKQSFETFVRID